MKLFGAIVGEKICGVTKTTFSNIDIPILIANSVSEFSDGTKSYFEIGALSIKDIEAQATPMGYWASYGISYSDADYLCIRDRIIEINTADIAGGGTIETLGKADQKALLTYFATTDSELKKVYSDSEIKQAIKNYINKAEEARANRYKAVEAIIIQNFGVSGAKEIGKDIKAGNEREQYVLEWDEGATDYLKSINDYVGAGFMENTAVVTSGISTVDLEAIRDDAIAILDTGLTAAGEFY